MAGAGGGGGPSRSASIVLLFPWYRPKKVDNYLNNIITYIILEIQMFLTLATGETQTNANEMEIATLDARLHIKIIKFHCYKPCKSDYKYAQYHIRHKSDRISTQIGCKIVTI